MIIPVDQGNLSLAASIHAEAWRASHCEFCSPEFVAAHTVERQKNYLQNELIAGKQMYMLYTPHPVGIVSIWNNLIENLYVSPAEQNKGYGKQLLDYAVSQCTGIPTLWALSNNPAIHLYERCGFYASGHQKPLKNSLYEIEMKKYDLTDEWFTVEQVNNVLWCISEYRHPEETHCYLLIGKKRALLIDTGLGVCDISKVVRHLTNLPIIAVATHIHWDHIGGLGSFPFIYAHAAEMNWLQGQFPLPLNAIRTMLQNGASLPAGFDATHYTLFSGTPNQLLSDGDCIDLGSLSLRVLHTPGHSPGHLCFWVDEHDWLFTGDLVYQGTLFAHYPSTDPQAYLHSLDKIANLPAARIFPAHHSLAVTPPLVQQMRDGLLLLQEKQLLHHGSSIHRFGQWAIQL